MRKLRVVRCINYYRITESLPKDIQGIFGTINSRISLRALMPSRYPPQMYNLKYTGLPLIYFEMSSFSNSKVILDALRDLVALVRFKKREKHPWRIVTFSKVAGFNFTKSNTLPWVFFTFFKLHKYYQIAQSITY